MTASRASIRRSSRRRRVWCTGVAVLMGVVTVACSSPEGTDAPTGKGGPYVDQVTDEIADATAEITDYPAPGPAFDTSSLAGKTIYYIPITIEAESFQVTSDVMKEAVEPLGVKVQVCDGHASPDKASACISEATDVKAAAIISDALPYGLAANAFDAAKRAGIPILISNQPVPEGQESNAKVAYHPGNPVTMNETAAKWIVADSKGGANVLVNEYTDSPATQAYMEEHGLKILDDKCEGCTTTVNKVASANFALIPSSTSSMVLKHPDATYFFTQYDTGLQPTMQGIQQAGALQKLRGVSTNGLLGAMKLLKEKKYLYADVASHYSYAAYALVDFAMRMAVGQPLPKETDVPIRLFTRDNIGDAGELTPEAQRSGAWFGEPTYKKMFAELWKKG